ncbi:sensor histidine kinase [Streptomyces bottropensis]|uniref:sensor histidine kinase n=1 Tax=Streptomyces bottropensis TaxID=42235 RepID=UPI0036A2AC15
MAEAFLQPPLPQRGRPRHPDGVGPPHSGGVLGHPLAHPHRSRPRPGHRPGEDAAGPGQPDLQRAPAGGTVTLTARHDAACVLTVEDTGRGIAADDFPHVFERFWRAEKSRSRRTGGSGMGLSIVRQFIEAHEGTVTVGGEPGKGCCSPSGSARAGTRTAAPHEVRRREARPTAAARDAAPPSADQ